MRRDHKLLVALLSLVGIAGWIYVLALSFEILRTFMTTVLLVVLIWTAFLLLFLYLFFHPLSVEERRKAPPLTRHEKIALKISYVIWFWATVLMLINVYQSLDTYPFIVSAGYIPMFIVMLIFGIIIWISKKALRPATQ